MNYDSGIELKGVQRSDDPLDGDAIGEAGATRGSSRRTLIIVALVALAALAAAAWYFMNRDGAAATADEADSAEQAQRVTVVAPGTTTIEGTVTATGTLAARREVPVGVVGEGGRVVRVTVDEGDFVRKGQLLVAIDRSVQAQRAEGARAQISVAQADLDLAQSNLSRALQLVERGFISKADVDRLTATRNAARARVQVARAQLNELQASNARLDIYAPTSGLVLQRSVEVGQTVGGGSPALFVLAQGGEMELQAKVGEAGLANLAVGTAATVVPAGSETEYSGQVWQIAPTIDESTRQGTARIALSYARGLKPGGFATATINSGTVVAPLLPESAILSDDEGTFVYVVDAKNTVRRRAVETGLVTEEGIAVIEGLTGTERIVLRAGGFLNAGDTVSPVAGER